jgi:hypothetical protein
MQMLPMVAIGSSPGQVSPDRIRHLIARLLDDSARPAERRRIMLAERASSYRDVLSDRSQVIGEPAFDLWKANVLRKYSALADAANHECYFEAEPIVEHYLL